MNDDRGRDTVGVCCRYSVALAALLLVAGACASTPEGTGTTGRQRETRRRGRTERLECGQATPRNPVHRQADEPLRGRGQDDRSSGAEFG